MEQEKAPGWCFLLLHIVSFWHFHLLYFRFILAR